MEFKRPFSDSDWQLTPVAVRLYIRQLEENILQLLSRMQDHDRRFDELESRLNQNSQNSNQPPSSDSPFKKPKKKAKKKKRKRGGQKGHKGHRQQLLEPTQVVKIKPDRCRCGSCRMKHGSLEPFYTHQCIELPKIKMDVTHYVLHRATCGRCGKTINSRLPQQHRSGFGPRLSAMIAELSGNHGASRQTVQSFCHSVLDIPISTGAIQNVIDRASAAIEPIYAHIGKVARSRPVNHIDETSWLQSGALKWLWTMANEKVTYFKVHPNRSKKAFESLIEDWKGILVSDDYNAYKNWVNRRQTCLAHLIRQAKALSERKDESISRFGKNLLTQLRLLCSWAHAPPSEKQWSEFYSGLVLLLILFEGADDDAGRLARRVGQEMDSLWVFLEQNGVEPTNNRAERALRFGVLWRKRSNGTQSDKGNRWVERILSLKQTCRQRALAPFPIFADAISAYFQGQRPDLSWI